MCSEKGNLHSRIISSKISLQASINSATEVLTSLGDQRLSTQFNPAKEVLTSLREQSLSSQFNPATELGPVHPRD